MSVKVSALTVTAAITQLYGIYDTMLMQKRNKQIESWTNNVIKHGHSLPPGKYDLSWLFTLVGSINQMDGEEEDFTKVRHLLAALISKGRPQGDLATQTNELLNDVPPVLPFVTILINIDTYLQEEARLAKDLTRETNQTTHHGNLA